MPEHSARRRVASLLICPLLLLPTACGGSGDGSSDDATAQPAGEVFSGVEVSGEPGQAPTITVDDPFETTETEAVVLDQGTGATVEEGDQASVQYSAVSGASGEEFDSSWSRGGQPVTFPLIEGGLLPGLLDGLVGQTYGSRVALAIAPEDGYGEEGVPEAGIESGDSLVFVVDLLEAQAAPLDTAEGQERELPAELPTLQTDADGIPTGFKADSRTPESVPRLVVAPAIVGDGPKLEEGQTATVHYVGQLYPDGKVFDESWSTGEPAQFPLTEGGLIQGFLDGLIGQRVGSRVVIAIPSELGYGRTGSEPAIPADADLIFVVDILAAS